jgi:simple sugar transport system ATP-binding protein
MAQEPAIHLSGITKRYPGVVANRDVELEVMPAEVHAIVGENGAGKSTLMKILYGMVRPDEGTVQVSGELTHFKSPKDAIDLGIGMVHQHFMLADNLTVLENIVLGSAPRKGLEIDFDAASKRIVELGELGGRAAACGDHEGAVSRCPDPHPGRAHRRPRSPGGR